MSYEEPPLTAHPQQEEKRSTQRTGIKPKSTKKKAGPDALQKFARKAWRFTWKTTLALLIVFAYLEWQIPSYTAEPGDQNAKLATIDSPRTRSLISPSQQIWKTHQVETETWDKRRLNISVLVPNHNTAPGVHKNPLTVIVTGFISPEWLLGYIRMRPGNAVLIYNSPRQKQILGMTTKSSSRITPSETEEDEGGIFSGLWETITTSPPGRWYAIHQGLHEAPVDVAEIVRWAIKEHYADRHRINLVGIGSGSLIATTAASMLQDMGYPVRSLTLVNPPADLQKSISDQLLDSPEFLRPALSDGLAFLFRRLKLEKHLPKLAPETKIQLLAPRSAIEIRESAVTPAAAYLKESDRYAQIDYNYSPMISDHNAWFIHDTIRKWLLTEEAIN